MWKPVAPTDLKANDVIRAGTMPARVLDWRWRIERAECVVSACYTDDAPRYYAGQPTECVYRLGENAEVWWCSERLDEPVTHVEQPHP